MIVLPRRFRPHSVVIRKLLPEDENGVAKEFSIEIQRVKVNLNYGIEQSKRGITTDDKMICYMELKDYLARDELGFTIHYHDDFHIHVDDILIFKNHKYVVTAVNEVLLDDDRPIRLEITAK